VTHTAISVSSRAWPSAAIANALPNSDTSIVARRPTRSVSWPPTIDAATCPAPKNETIAPASATVAPRAFVR
jgi:hypothetical protein